MPKEAGWAYEVDLWQRGYRFVAGVDEVGRGPLAGPVVAAAVIWAPGDFVPGLMDSKRLAAHRREELARIIRQRALAWGIGAASARYIDRHNIWQATYLAMRRALRRLPVAPDFVLVDGFPIPGLPWPQQGLPGGDAVSASIAAASILAKVWRDALMERLDRRYPQYFFAQNRGYPTPQHLAALREFGPSPHHRLSYAPLKTGSKNVHLSSRYSGACGEIK